MIEVREMLGLSRTYLRGGCALAGLAVGLLASSTAMAEAPVSAAEPVDGTQVQVDQAAPQAAAPEIVTEAADPTAAVEADAPELAADGPSDPLGQALLQLLGPGSGHEDSTIAAFYASRNYAPVWVAAEGLTPAGDELFATLSDAASDGLHQDDYLHDPIYSRLDVAAPQTRAELEVQMTDAFLRYGTDLMQGRFRQREATSAMRDFTPDADLTQPLRYAADTGLVGDTLRSLAPPHAEYHALRDALAGYRAIAAAGGWPQVPDTGASLEPGARGSAISALRARLAATGDYVAPAEGVSDDTYYDRQLADAVEAFQARHGLLEDAVVGPRTLSALNASVDYRIRQIEASMERWRWYPRDLGDKHLFVNVPEFIVRGVDGDAEPLVMRVVVGTQRNQTPIFNDTMEYAQLNPYWNVPQSIADNEYLPALRNDPFYLLNQNIRILSGGREINPVLVDWSSVSGRFPYALRQEPGGGNALGRIKFMFPNGHSVYMHDTPSRSLFERTARSFSHGCIRLQDPMRMAGFVFNGQYTEEEVEAMIASGRTRDVIMDHPIPVYIGYFTARANESGTVSFFGDIYERDTVLMQAMNDAMPEPPMQVAETASEQGLN
ncbi:MAG: L,D-transpeptidase family protein [Alphaproteobacteria bacterium]